MRVTETEWLRHLSTTHRAAAKARALTLAAAYRRAGVLRSLVWSQILEARRCSAPRLP